MTSYYSNDELRKAALVAVIGGSVGVAGVYFGNTKDVATWWKSLKKPRYVPQELNHPVALVANAVAGAAGPTSTYLIYLEGTKYNDVRVALVMYGGTLVISLIAGYAFNKRRCLQHSSMLTGAAALSCVATNFLYYRISPRAAMILAPCTLLCLLSSSMLCTMQRLNKADTKA